MVGRLDCIGQSRPAVHFLCYLIIVLAYITIVGDEIESIKIGFVERKEHCGAQCQAREEQKNRLVVCVGESDDTVKQALHEDGLIRHILFAEGGEPDHGGGQHGEGQAIGENDSDSHDLTKILYCR